LADNSNTPAMVAAPRARTVLMKPYSRSGVDEGLDEEIEALEAARDGKAEEDAIEDKVPDTQEEITFKKRYGDLRRHSQKTEAKLQAQITALEDRLNASQANEMSLPRTDEELAAWVKEYPDAASMVETLAAKKAKELMAGFDSKFQRVDTLNAEINEAKLKRDLLLLHPDYEEVAESVEWGDFVDKLSSRHQSMLLDPDADADTISGYITMYKAQKEGTKPVSKRTNNQPERAPGGGTPRPGKSSGTRWSETKVEALSAREYERYEDEIRASVENGTFVYDHKSSRA
jgi:hypothetical protein